MFKFSDLKLMTNTILSFLAALLPSTDALCRWYFRHFDTPAPPVLPPVFPRYFPLCFPPFTPYVLPEYRSTGGSTNVTGVRNAHDTSLIQNNIGIV